MANRYWVGNGGNWNDTAHWSTTSGGAGGASVPTSADNAIFNGSSFSSGSQTVTINATANCLDFDWNGVTNTPTLAISNDINVYGNFRTVSGMNRSGDAYIYMKATSTGFTVTSGGKQFTRMQFDGAGGEWTLQDALNITYLDLNQGTLITNNQTVTVFSFWSDYNTTRGLTLGSSTWNNSGLFFISNGTFNLNAGTSTINQTFTDTGWSALTYKPNVNVNPTFYNLNFTGNGRQMIEVGSSCTTFTCNNLTRTGGTDVLNALVFMDNGSDTAVSWVVSGTFTATGNAANKRLFVGRRTTDESGMMNKIVISAAAVSLTNVDFHWVTGAGAATWSGTSIGNSGGNSNITFTTPVTRYWVGNGGNYNDTAHWSTSSGGSTGASMPLGQDIAIFDANSFSSASQTITINILTIGNIDFTGVDSSPTVGAFQNWGGNRTIFVGDITANTGMNWTDNSVFFFKGYKNQTIIAGGREFTDELWICTDYTLTLGGDCVFSSGAYAWGGKGTIDLNDYDLTITSIGDYSANYDFTWYLGSGTLTLTKSSGSLIDNYGNLIFVPETSTIYCSDTGASGKTFDTNGREHYNLELASSSGGWLVWGTGGSILNNFTIHKPNNIDFDGGTLSIGHLIANGDVSNIIVLQNTDGLTSIDDVVQQVDYCTITNNVGIGQILSSTDTGWLLPTVADFLDDGGYETWSNLSNALTDDGTYASIIYHAAQTFWTDAIYMSGFDFSSIPDEATLLGLEVSIEAFVPSGDPTLIEAYPFIDLSEDAWDYYEPSIPPDGYYDSAPWGVVFPTSAGNPQIFGGPTHLWPSFLDVAQLKGTGIWVGMDIDDFGGAPGEDITVNVDVIKVKAYYGITKPLWYASNSTDGGGNTGWIFGTYQESERGAHLVGKATANSERAGHLVGKATANSERGGHLIGVYPVEVFYDDFNDNSIDGAKWGNWSGGHAVETGQQLRFNSADVGVAAYYGMDSQSLYSLHNSVIRADMYQPPGAPTSYGAYFQLAIDSDYAIYISYYDGYLNAVKKVAGVQTNLGNIPYNYLEQKHLQFRETGGTIYFEYSADGINWNTLGTLAAPYPLNITQVVVELLVGNWQPEASTTYTIFDNVNIYSVNSERAATLRGKLTSFAERAATLIGQALTNSERAATIHGKATANSERAGHITGKQTDNSERSAKLHGQALTNAERAGHLTGKDTANATRGAKTTGKQTDSSERGGHLVGEAHTNSERGGHLIGMATAFVERLAKLIGKLATNSERGGHLTGKATANSQRAAKIHGTLDDQSERSAKLHGQILTYVERNAHLFGKATANAQRSGKIHGKLYAQSERGVFMRGGIPVYDERGVRIHGKNTAFSERWVRLVGKAVIGRPTPLGPGNPPTILGSMPTYTELGSVQPPTVIESKKKSTVLDVEAPTTL